MIDLTALELKSGTEKPDINFIDFHNELIVDLSEEIQTQPIALSIGTHHFKREIYPTPFASYGDFSCIVGASKSKKTYLKSLFTARYIGGSSSQYAPDIKGHHSEGKWVLEFDTEQSKFHSQRAFRRIPEMTGFNYPYYKCFYLREKSPQERRAFINWIFTESEYKDNLGWVVIDGIADLVTDFNSLLECSDLVGDLLRWTGSTKSHICTILHKNFGTSKPTGHIGSSVLKKAETVTFVEKNEDDGSVKVTSEYSRNLSFDAFTFSVDPETWLPTTKTTWL